MVKLNRLLFFICALSVLSQCQHEPPLDPDGTFSEYCNPDSVYFGNTVLPILQSNCAMSGCHDATSHRDGINLSSYYDIMNSDVVVAGNANESELIEVLTETGDDLMPPPPNAPLTSEQIALLSLWINQGARFNNCAGCDTNQFTFSAHIWPIIQNNCTGCHSGANPDGGVALTNHAEIAASANNGSLMGVLTATNGYNLMPQNSYGLPQCKITQIENWINHGTPND